MIKDYVYWRLPIADCLQPTAHEDNSLFTLIGIIPLAFKL